MFDPFTILSAETVVFELGLVFKTVAHLDFYANIELTADCLLVIDPMSKTNGLDVIVDVVVVDVVFGANVAYAVIAFCTVVSGAIAVWPRKHWRRINNKIQ